MRKLQNIYVYQLNLFDDFNKAIVHYDYKGDLCFYKGALKELSLSQAFMEESMCRLELDAELHTVLDTNAKAKPGFQKPLQSVILLSWKKDALQDTYSISILTKALEYGAYCIDDPTLVFKREVRTSSHLRAGGAWLTTNHGQIRKFLSYGLEENYTTSFEILTSKWESILSLGMTSSLPISIDSMPNICVVADLERDIDVKAIYVQEGTVDSDNETDYECFDGMVDENGRVTKYPLRVKKIGNKQEDYRFVLANGMKLIRINTTDGNCLGSPRFITEIAEKAHYANQVEEAEYAKVIQFRMPFMKGIILEFDLERYLEEKQTYFIIDIYGMEWYIGEIDMIVPVSVFKGHNLFTKEACRARGDEHYGYDAYVARCLRGSYDMTFTNGVTVTGKYYPNNEFFRVVKVNKKPKEVTPTSYQYIQSLGNLENEAAIGLTDYLFNHAEKCTVDIAAAKTSLGMNGLDADDYANSLVSKTHTLLEVAPELFQTSLVQSAILRNVDGVIMDQCAGRVMTDGAYHFMIGDPTAILHGESFNGYLNLGEREVLKQDEIAGIIPKGKTYFNGFNDIQAVGFRSPLINQNDVLIYNFHNDDELDRWLGHLDGAIIYNCYDPDALRQQGGDYDGDKAKVSFDETLLKSVPLSNDGTQLPLIFHPMEGIKAKATPMSKLALDELDSRTMDNQTGKFTDMATFYTNMRTAIKKNFSLFAANCDKWSVEEFYQNYCLLFPHTEVTLQNLIDGTVSVQRLKEIALTEGRNILSEYAYKETVTSFSISSEIDFTKHGNRMPFPSECVTNHTLKWLYSKKGKLLPGDARLMNVEYGLKAHVWYVIDRFGRKHENRVYVLDTPMQNINDYTRAKWGTLKGDILKKAPKADFLSLIMRRLNNFVVPFEVNMILDDVRTLRKEYAERYSMIGHIQVFNELTGHMVRVSANLSKDEVKAQAREIEADIQEKSLRITNNRSHFALAALTISRETGTNDDIFPLAIAFDGIIDLLAQSGVCSTRHIRVDVPEGTSAINIVDGSACYVHPFMETSHPVELPDVKLPDGAYKVVSLVNKRFMVIGKVVDENDISLISKHTTNTIFNDTKGNAHRVIVKNNLSYPVKLVGFQYTPERRNAESALKVLLANNGLVDIVAQNINGVDRPAVSVNGSLVGVIEFTSSKGKGRDNSYVDIDLLIGQKITLDLSETSCYYFNKKTKAYTMSKTLFANAMITTVREIGVPLAEWQRDLDFKLECLYRDIVEEEGRYKTLADFGYTVADFMIAETPSADSIIAYLKLLNGNNFVDVTIAYDANKVPYVLEVCKNGVPINISSEDLDPIKRTCCREAIFAIAKRDFKANEIETAQLNKRKEFEESIQAKRDASAKRIAELLAKKELAKKKAAKVKSARKKAARKKASKEKASKERADKQRAAKKRMSKGKKFKKFK